MERVPPDIDKVEHQMLPEVLMTPSHAELKGQNAAAPKSSSKSSVILNVAAIVVLIASLVAIVKGTEMQRAGEGVLCILTSISVTCLVGYLHFKND